MDDDTGWFPGDEPRAEDEGRFLAAVRAAAAADGFVDVTPEMTSVMALGGFVPMLLRVEVPGLPASLANLQVGYTTGDEVGAPRLVGEWGDEYLLDNHGRYPDDLSIEGVQATPEEFAGFAVAGYGGNSVVTSTLKSGAGAVVLSALNGASQTQERCWRATAAGFVGSGGWSRARAGSADVC